VRANAWIAAGALVLALATSMSRANVYSLMYAGEVVGLALLFYGFNVDALGSRPPARVRRRPPAVLAPAAGLDPHG
jgi:hypothetical protein